MKGETQMSKHNPSEDKVFNPSLESLQPLELLKPVEPRQPDWWRCLRYGPVSGRYYGEMTTPNAGRYALDLRVDIDPRHANSPVMDRVSGDIYQVYRFNWFGRTITWRVYRESGIVDNPTVTWSGCSVGITGRVRFWKGIHLITDVSIVIPWGSFQPAGPAEVTFTEAFGGTSSYSCDRKSSAFREVTLEVDVCDSVNAAPILPSYDTNAHSTRPADLPQRTLTIEEAYDEAGIDVTITPTHTIIDDSAAQFNTWSDAELHDAMELHFSRYPGTWPKWHMWCLLAGSYDLSGVGGVMFDYGTQYGGPGELPERQGCAVFRNHSWFNNLVSNPTNDTQAAALRQFLYVYVHEMGHAFNFLHSWDKGRPDALSWMNYPQYVTNFWNNFRFRFDDEELIHLRHGDRASVIMGGDPWASGGHMEAPSGAMADQVGEAPVELLVRSKSYFQFMEPIIIELRIRNTTDLPLELDTQLHPEFGGVIVYIRRPDGRILQYAPIACKLATPELGVLKPEHEAVKGEDRHSQNVFLSYGIYGHYFDMPGEYRVRAVYQGTGNMLIASNMHRVRIGRPFSHDEERMAQDFFTYEAGMALYLNGSSSPFLQKGMDTLQDMADRFKESPVGAHLSLTLGQNLARPFFRIEDEKLVEVRAANPEEALALTAQAMKQQERDESTLTNISYHQLRRTRANLMVTMDEKDEAKKELKALVRYLKKRGVNQPVLDEIEAYAKSL
jgi:hypothetical protein